MGARRWLTALTVASMAIVLPASSIAPSSAAAVRGRKALPGAVPSWAKASRARGEATGPVALTVALRWRNGGQLADVDRAVSDPEGPDYKHYLSAEAFRHRFSPSRASVAAVKRYLRRKGLRVNGVSRSRMLIKAVGSTHDAERAFHTKLREFRHARRTLRAPATPVSLPKSLAGSVASVVGLDQTMLRPLAHPASAPPPAFVNARPCSHYWGRALAARPIERAYSQVQPWVVCGYEPDQLQGAYGVDGLISSGTDGSGQTVGIIDAFSATTIIRDVNTYSRRHGLPPAQITKTRDRGCMAGCTNADRQGWYGEETLDLEAVHTMAPGAHLAYYGAADPSNRGLLNSLGRVLDDDQASIVTNSYGTIGLAPSRPTVKAQERLAQQAIAQGVGLYFSSGDEGDERIELGRVSTDYPASSPRVTAVGGTSLGVGPLQNHLFELGWGTRLSLLGKNGWKPRPPGGFLYGSGGGTSPLFGEPAYQIPVVPRRLATLYGGRSRVVPDISMDGDPNTGMLVGETQTFPGGHTRYGEYRIGGTSLSSPLLAGYMALANQLAGARLGFINPALYELSGDAAIRDIRPAQTRVAAVVGFFNNNVDSSDGKLIELRTFDHDSTLRTKPGYDNVTGLGSPAGDNLIEALAGP